MPDTCPMCGEDLEGDDTIISCSACGGEGCTDNCIPGGRGTACVDCEEAEPSAGDDEGPKDDADA